MLEEKEERISTAPLEEEEDKSQNHDQTEKEVEEFPMMSPAEKRLFDLRLKINQARKANMNEVEEEYKRLHQKSRRSKNSEDAEEKDEDEELTSRSTRKKQNKDKDADALGWILSTTAADAEWIGTKNKRKAEIAATYGLSSFTTDASYRAYEKRAAKLEQNIASKPTENERQPTSLEINPFDYGRVNADTSADALEKLRQDVLDRENQRKKFSRRRMHTDAEDVDYINDKNAKFNKKLKKAFDKYTVEIRQNLERGTAI